MKKPSMSERLLAITAGSAERASKSVDPQDSIAAKPPVTMPGQLGAFRLEAKRYQDRIDALEARLREAEQPSSMLEIPLAELHAAPGRKRNLTREQYAELRDNLKQNDLVTPITVRPRDEGGYEIVSGHNRVDIYRELGRSSIPGVVRDTEAAQADINAFYANLFQPDLPDYEKYLGFQMIRARRPELSQEQIAEFSGVSQSLLSRLLSFEDLPEAAHAILAEHPAILGAAAASSLAGLAKRGKGDAVVQALQKVADEGLDQTQAVAFASRAEADEKPQKPKSNVEITSYKIGKAQLCSYRKSDTMLRVDFKSPEHAAAVHEEIQKVLERYAAGLKRMS
jgi:ParB family chromosome partitioning protein